MSAPADEPAEHEPASERSRPDRLALALARVQVAMRQRHSGAGQSEYDALFGDHPDLAGGPGGGAIEDEGGER